MNRVSRRTILLGAAGGTAALAGTLANRNRALAQAAGPIRIPYIVAMSGSFGIIGEPIRIGGEIAQANINKAGGVNGRPIELIFRDDKLRPDETVGAAREFIGQGHRIMVAGLTGPTTFPLMPIMAETKTVLMTTAIGMPVTHEAFNRYTFRCIDNEYQRVRALAQFAADKYPDVKVWGATMSDTATYRTAYETFGKLLTRLLAEKGKTATFADPILNKLGGNDFRTNVAQMAGQNLEGVFALVSGADGVTFWQQARAFGIGKNLKVVLDQSIDMGIGKALRASLPPNLWTIQVWNERLYRDSPESKALYEAYVARTKEPMPSDYIAYATVPVHAIVAALRATGGSDDPDKLIPALESVKFGTAKGQAWFRKEDHQAVLDTCMIAREAIAQDPGIAITDAFRIPGTSLLEPADPGVAFKI